MGGGREGEREIGKEGKKGDENFTNIEIDHRCAARLHYSFHGPCRRASGF
tara:strand:+ start:473 stop:622 length:150 start_codon:yes stop_codon:yes gene_type:complete